MYGNLLALGEKVYRIKVSRSGMKVKYSEYTGAVGKVNVTKNWGGKAVPECVVVTGATDEGKCAFDIASKGDFVLPVGEYRVLCAWLPLVRVDASKTNITFTVSESEVAAPEWGKGLKMKAQVGWDSKTSKVTLNPLPTIVGSSGEYYVGDFMEDGKFKINVDFTTANGDPVGRGTTWSKTVIGGGG
ncbi:MAG: hypothetical protein Kow00107_08320 [Planctomycetota bacterium]